MDKKTPRQEFIEKWNSSSREERGRILRGLRWKPREFTRGFYTDQDIREISELGIHTKVHDMNGTVRDQLIERALEPQIPTQPEGCLSVLRGRRS